MPDIYHTFTIDVPMENVFWGVSTSNGLDHWWTKSSRAIPARGATYILDFGPGYTWQALVTKYEEGKEFELQITDADADWMNTKVGFSLSAKSEGVTIVEFYHTGWPSANEHYKVSCYCWAMYLRILKRYLESGEEVSYEKRLSV